MPDLIKRMRKARWQLALSLTFSSVLVLGWPLGRLVPKVEASNPVIQNGLKIDICKTTDQDDDYICKSDGTTTCPYTEATVSLPGPLGPEHDIELKSSGDGNLKFEPQSFKLECGKSICVKIWGLQKGSAVDSTYVDGYVDSIKITTENMTVFEGVEIKFDGDFYLNVDTRDYGRRPFASS